MIELREEIAAGRFTKEDVAVSLWRILRGNAPPPYDDAVKFFEYTHLTETLQKVLSNVLGRVSGRGGDKVLILKSGFGGGKTHILAAVYYLFRVDLGRIENTEVGRFISRYGVPEASVCAVDMSAENLWPPWLFLERCLNRSLGREVPETDVLKSALEGKGPVVIIVDELGEFFRFLETRRPQQRDQEASATLLFFRRLTDALGNRDILVVSMPDDSAPYSDWVKKKLSDLYELLRRGGTDHVPIASVEEVYKIIKRRLFKRVDEADAEATAAEYANYYKKWGELFNSGWVGINELRLAYPFHPAFIRTLWERTSTIPEFQRTRDLIYILSLAAYRKLSGVKEFRDLILPGDLDLLDREFKDFFTVGVGRPSYAGIIDHDLAEARRLGELHYYAAAGLYVYSLIGGDVKKTGATLADIRTLAAKPKLTDPKAVDKAVEELLERLWYMETEGNRYWFQAEPNINKVLEESKNAVRDDEAFEVLAEEVGRFKKSLKWWRFHIDVLTTPSEVKDEKAFRLYIWSPRSPGVDCNRGLEELVSMADRLKYRNSFVVLLHGGVPLDQAKYLVACESLKKRFQGDQLRRLEALCEKKALDFYITFYRSFNCLAIPYGRDVLFQKIELELGEPLERGEKAAVKLRELLSAQIKRTLEDIAKFVESLNDKFYFQTYLEPRLRNAGRVLISEAKEDLYRDPDLPITSPDEIDSVLKRIAEEGKVVLSCGTTYYWPQAEKELRSLPDSEIVRKAIKMLECEPRDAQSILLTPPKEVMDLVEMAKKAAKPVEVVEVAKPQPLCVEKIVPLGEAVGSSLLRLSISGDNVYRVKLLIEQLSAVGVEVVDASASAEFSDEGITSTWSAKDLTAVKKLLSYLITLGSEGGRASVSLEVDVKEKEITQSVANLAKIYNDVKILARVRSCS